MIVAGCRSVLSLKPPWVWTEHETVELADRYRRCNRLAWSPPIDPFVVGEIVEARRSIGGALLSSLSGDASYILSYTPAKMRQSRETRVNNAPGLLARQGRCGWS